MRDAAVADTGPAVTGQVVAASLATLEQSVSATGTLTPTVQEEISFAASGTVTSVDVAVGAGADRRRAQPRRSARGWGAAAVGRLTVLTH